MKKCIPLYATKKKNSYFAMYVGHPILQILNHIQLSSIYSSQAYTALKYV